MSKKLQFLLLAVWFLTTVGILWGAVGSQYVFTLGTAPSNPASGKISMYGDQNLGRLHCIGSDGLTVTCIDFSAGVSTGTTPPSVTSGTGGVDGYSEGTIPSVCPASGVDCVYADSTQNGLLGNFNNDGYKPLVRGPTSATTVGHCVQYADTKGSLLASFGSTCGGGGGGFSGGCGPSGAVTMTGSDITLCTISNVSALASGSCYMFTGIAQAAQNYQVFIYVDATLVSTPISNNNTWAGYFINWQTLYCNNAGVQNAQQLVPVSSGYQNTGFQYGVGSTNFLTEASGSYPKTPTGVDWTTTHTITVKMNAASGNGFLYGFKVN